MEKILQRNAIQNQDRINNVENLDEILNDKTQKDRILLLIHELQKFQEYQGFQNYL